MIRSKSQRVTLVRRRRPRRRFDYRAMLWMLRPELARTMLAEREPSLFDQTEVPRPRHPQLFSGN